METSTNLPTGIGGLDLDCLDENEGVVIDKTVLSSAEEFHSFSKAAVVCNDISNQALLGKGLSYILQIVCNHSV